MLSQTREIAQGIKGLEDDSNNAVTGRKINAPLRRQGPVSEWGSSALMGVERPRGGTRRPQRSAMQLNAVKGTSIDKIAMRERWNHGAGDGTGGSLGDEPGLSRRTVEGNLQVFAGTAEGLSQMVPELNVLNAPYLFSSARHADRALDGPVRKRLRPIMARRGLVFGAWTAFGFRSWYTRNRAIRRPQDLQGLQGGDTDPAPSAHRYWLLS